MDSEKTRLGLDIGTNSIGWALLNLDENNKPNKIIDMGVRIFSDGRNPQDKTTLAASRRTARGIRRNRDRFLQRQKRIINQLIRMGLFPKDKEEQENLKSLDVLLLRARAIKKNEKLEPYELGRVILNLSKHRGFKSNRKDVNENSDTKISEASEKLKVLLKENKCLSFGDFINQLSKKGLSTKATVENGFYLTRALVENEFDEIVKIQAKKNRIGDKEWKKLKGYIFHQRPLKPIEVGKCSIYIDKSRGFQFLPSFEAFRLLSNLHNLRWRDEHFKEQKFTTDEISKIFNEVKLKKQIKYSDVKKIANQPKDLIYTIEPSSGLVMSMCATNYFFGNLKKGIISKTWEKLSLFEKDELAEKFFLSNDEDLSKNIKVLEFLADLDKEAILEANVQKFRESTCAFSKEAMQKIIEISLKDGLSPGELIHQLRQNESIEQENEKLDYYGKSIPQIVVPIPEEIKRKATSIDKDEKDYGKIANPTVHIGLNQLRKLINEVIGRYGKPNEIYIEFVRDLKMSKKAKIEYNKRTKKNEDINSKAKEFIEKQKHATSSFNMEKVKLWFEIERVLDRRCVYSGEPISQEMVLTEAVEVDHILPFSRTLDDSLSNKVLVLTRENRQKKNKTPFEQYSKDSVRWQKMLCRADKLPHSKKWRFSEDAINRYSDQGFLARQLTDTSYLSKIAKKYLGTLIHPDNIVTSPGRLTALVRRKLGLNKMISSNFEKNRNDHRHHAIDAIIVALLERSFLQKISKYNSDEISHKIKVEEPWSNFHAEVKKKVDGIVVSHRVDHTENQDFLDQTSFGLRAPVSEFQEKNHLKLITTKSFESLTSNDLNKIVSKALRDSVSKDGKDFLEKNKIRRVKVYGTCKEEFDKIGESHDSYIAKIVHGKDNKHYVCYKKNGIYKVFIWKVPNPEKDMGYDVSVTFLYYYDLKSYRGDPEIIKPHPAAKLVCILSNGDTIALNNGKLGDKLYKVKSFRTKSNQIQFLEINKASKEEDEKEFLLAVSRLPSRQFRKVHVSPSGLVKDPGSIF